MPINRDSPIPLHHQVRNYLLGCIERGELSPGQKLLQEREYASRFGISLAPVRQAILDLVKENYLYRVPGRGTFVCEQKVEEKISILSSFTASMQAKGLNAVTRVVELRLGKIPAAIRAQFQAKEQQFVFLQRVALVDGEAIALLSSYLPAQACTRVGEDRSEWPVTLQNIGRALRYCAGESRKHHRSSALS